MRCIESILVSERQRYQLETMFFQLVLCIVLQKRGVNKSLSDDCRGTLSIRTNVGAFPLISCPTKNTFKRGERYSTYNINDVTVLKV